MPSPLLMLWNAADEDARLSLLRDLAIPFPANSPVEYAKNALANLTEPEWREVYDWLGEMHWMPPGVN